MGKPIPVPPEVIEQREAITRDFHQRFFGEEPASVSGYQSTTQSGHQVARWKEEEMHVYGHCSECGDLAVSTGYKSADQARAQMENFKPTEFHEHGREARWRNGG